MAIRDLELFGESWIRLLRVEVTTLKALRYILETAGKFKNIGTDFELEPRIEEGGVSIIFSSPGATFEGE
jgi:hypothetical protein